MGRISRNKVPALLKALYFPPNTPGQIANGKTFHFKKVSKSDFVNTNLKPNFNFHFRFVLSIVECYAVLILTNAIC